MNIASVIILAALLGVIAGYCIAWIALGWKAEELSAQLAESDAVIAYYLGDKAQAIARMGTYSVGVDADAWDDDVWDFDEAEPIAPGREGQAG